ncbi:MAG: YceI family protein [Dokdonella sp.]|uniref:YceI family protein n=1 Tax=Dokdonella sp. TaxID=2291710 RepID=UPI003264BDA8
MSIERNARTLSRPPPPRASERLAVSAVTLMVAIAAMFTALPALASSDTYRFDPVHTQIWFSADHQKFSHPLGRLRVKEGWFRFDPKDWSASHVDVVVDLASADMGDGKWSDTVKSGQFLDAQRWPTAHFVSDRVEQTDANHGVIHGTLTFHGVAKAVDVAFTLNRIANDPYLFKKKAGFSASATLDRFAFGMERFKEVVGAPVDLRLEIEGISDDAAANASNHREP